MASIRYIRSMLQVEVGTDFALSHLQFKRDKQLKGTAQVDDMQGGTLAPTEVFAVAFEKVVTARMVWIEVNGDVEVRFNGAVAGPLLKSLDAATMLGVTPAPARMFWEGVITAIELVNPNLANPVDFVVYLAGDPT